MKRFLAFSIAIIVPFLVLSLILLQPAALKEDLSSLPPILGTTSSAGPTEYQGIIYETITSDNYSVEAVNVALKHCPIGQAILLTSGTYIFNDVIHVPEGKILVGSIGMGGGIGTVITTNLSDDGIRNHGYIDIGDGGNIVRNIKTLNGYFFFGSNSHDFILQDCEYNGPTDASAGQVTMYGFLIYISAKGDYDNGEFVRCIARNVPCFGFLVGADVSKNSEHFGANAYSAHGWSWTDCQAYDCGIANGNYSNSSSFVYGCGFDFFEGFGPKDNVAGMRVTGCIANGNEADGFHIEYKMNITDFVFTDCTANSNGQWFKLGHTTNPLSGLLIGTGFYLGGSDTSQTKVVNCLAKDNWGYSTKAGGYGIFDSQMHSDLDGAYTQGTGAG